MEMQRRNESKDADDACFDKGRFGSEKPSDTRGPECKHSEPDRLVPGRDSGNSDSSRATAIRDAISPKGEGLPGRSQTRQTSLPFMPTADASLQNCRPWKTRAHTLSETPFSRECTMGTSGRGGQFLTGGHPQGISTPSGPDPEDSHMRAHVSEASNPADPRGRRAMLELF